MGAHVHFVALLLTEWHLAVMVEPPVGHRIFNAMHLLTASILHP